MFGSGSPFSYLPSLRNETEKNDGVFSVLRSYRLSLSSSLFGPVGSPVDLPVKFP